LVYFPPFWYIVPKKNLVTLDITWTFRSLNLFFL
jgi:hypothetical protein